MEAPALPTGGNNYVRSQGQNVSRFRILHLTAAVHLSKVTAGPEYIFPYRHLEPPVGTKRLPGGRTVRHPLMTAVQPYKAPHRQLKPSSL